MSSAELLEEVRRWLRFSHEDLRAAEALLTAAGARPRHACWLAQQAAEKAIKAALAYEQTSFPFRHDLDALRNLLPEGWAVKALCPDLAELTEWAVEARYPGDSPEATDVEAQCAVAQARAVWQCVAQDMSARGVHVDSP
jgi:HEPN domain-containing protein